MWIFQNFVIWFNHEKTTEELRIPKPKLEEILLIPMSNLWKCAQGADSAATEVCHFWHLKTRPITQKLISHQFVFLLTQNGPLQAEISKY